LEIELEAFYLVDGVLLKWVLWTKERAGRIFVKRDRGRDGRCNPRQQGVYSGPIFYFLASHLDVSTTGSLPNVCWSKWGLQ
jgi:hypothetical protein